MLGSREDAEDVVQEALLRAWRKREQFQGRSSFRAWLYGIATNHGTRGPRATDPSGGTLGTMTKADLHRLVDALPDASVEPAGVVLERIRDPLVAVHFAAPFDDEAVTAEEEAMAAESRAALARGEGVPLDQAMADPETERH